MAEKLNVLPAAREMFPKSANATVLIRDAWHPDRSTMKTPPANGTDGWELIAKLASRANLEVLQAAGYTYVNLECGGTSNPFRHAPIAGLLGR
ncbi:MAG: hypothetical protein KIT69_06880 [Propionibacteriaceae bacterium]|nr:hypothetical protein [Propionibacteriaceae bacterium]